MCAQQAMIHELVGIKDNTAELTSPKVAEQYRYAAVPGSSARVYAHFQQWLEI